MIPVLSVLLLLLATPRLEVCLSPGCTADGARACLEKLQTLTGPAYNVQEGGCVSLCGKGPVVTVQLDDDDNDKTKKILYKRVVDETMLKLLSEDLRVAIPTELIQGYDCIAQAHAYFDKKKYVEAISLYQEGIDKTKDIAKDYGGAWLAKAWRSLAHCHLHASDKELALEAISQALEIDHGDIDLSWDCKIKVCESLKDAKGEYEALQAYFELVSSSSATPSRNDANRRRTLGFRLQKLERDLTLF